jgi:hypothetical protein
MRLRGLPASEGSIFSHSLLSHFADSRRMRIGYKVPEASLVCLAMSAPDSPVNGPSRNCPSTWRVGPERRGESLLIHETLHRVGETVKSDEVFLLERIPQLSYLRLERLDVLVSRTAFSETTRQSPRSQSTPSPSRSVTNRQITHQAAGEGLRTSGGPPAIRNRAEENGTHPRGWIPWCWFRIEAGLLGGGGDAGLFG